MTTANDLAVRRALEAARVLCSSMRTAALARACGCASRNEKALSHLSARWGAIVIFGRALGLRVGGRASPSRGGQIQCTQKASGDNRL
jgi:hypothetical protein